MSARECRKNSDDEASGEIVQIRGGKLRLRKPRSVQVRYGQWKAVKAHRVRPWKNPDHSGASRYLIAFFDCSH